MKHDDKTVFSSVTWARALDVELPDPLPWGKWELITKAEFQKRMESN